MARNRWGLRPFLTYRKNKRQTIQMWRVSILIGPPKIDCFVQCENRLVLIDPADSTQHTYRLPQELQSGGYSVYFLPDEQILIDKREGYW